jgi:hypothetical protein
MRLADVPGATLLYRPPELGSGCLCIRWWGLLGWVDWGSGVCQLAPDCWGLWFTFHVHFVGVGLQTVCWAAFDPV